MGWLHKLLVRAALLFFCSSSLSQITTVRAQRAMVYTWSYGYFQDQTPIEPTLEELNFLICQTNAFLTPDYAQALENPTVNVEAFKIAYTFDATATPALTVQHAINVTAEEGFTIPPPNGLAALTLTADVGQLIDAIWTIGPTSSLYSINSASFSKGAGPAPTENVVLETAVCEEEEENNNVTAVPNVVSDTNGTTPAPTVISTGDGLPTLAPSISNFPNVSSAPTVSPAPTTQVDMSSPTLDPGALQPNELGLAYFTLSYIFEQGTAEQREPTVEEINALMCQTNRFFADRIQTETGDSSIQHEARYIDWTYNNQEQAAVTIFFASYAENEVGDIIDTDTIVAAMSTIGQDDIILYIEEYVYQTGVDGSLFNNVIAVSVDSDDSLESFPSGELVSAECDSEENQTPSPTIPGASTSSPAPTATESGGTPVPTAGGSAPNTNEMVYVQLDYGFEEGTDLRDPTPEEINELMCITMQFFQDRIRSATGDDMVQAQAMYIDWSYNEGAAQPISVTFATNATYFGTMDAVPQQEVFDALEVTTAEIVDYLSNYVLDSSGAGVSEGSLFQDVISSDFTTLVNIVVPLGQIPMADCGTTMAPTAIMPSVSNQPSFSPTSESLTARPTLTNMSSSLQPTTPPTLNSSSSQPTSLLPPNITEPTLMPSIQPTTSPVQLTSGEFAVNVDFLVSNMVGTTDPQLIRLAGLDDAWSAFSEQIAQNISSNYIYTGRQRNRRFLSIDFVSDSSIVSEIAEIACPDGTDKDSICHLAAAEYKYFIQNESLPDVQKLFFEETTTAIYNGTFQFVLKEVNPDSPLVIGTIADPGEFVDIQIAVRFVVSNIAGIASSDQINASDLAASWPIFTNEMVQNLTDQYVLPPASSDGRQLREGRRLSVALKPDSSVVYNIERIECPENSYPGLICHNADARYYLALQGENQWAIESLYRRETLEAATDGTYDSILKRDFPDTDLNIGILPPPPTIAPSTAAPTISASPTMVEDPTKKKETGVFPVEVEFIISNTDGIEASSGIQNAGLLNSWRRFAEEITENVTSTYISPSRRLRGSSWPHRHLAIQYLNNSAIVTDITGVACNDTRAHPDSICHLAKASYKYSIVEEIKLFVNETFYNETYEAIYNGTFQYILDQETSPDVRLVAGIIPNIGGSDEGGIMLWAVFLIVIVVLLAVALCHYLIYLCFLQDKEEDLESYQEEDFVYDFFIPKDIKVQTEVDDASKSLGVTPDEASTASSDDEFAQPVEVGEEEEVAVWPDEVEEDDHEGEVWEDEGEAEVEGETWDEENDAYATADEDGEDEQWENEVDYVKQLEGDYAKSAHNLLLGNGDDSDHALVRSLSSGSAAELHKKLLEDGTAQQRLSLIEGSSAAMEQRRLLLEDGNATEEDEEVTDGATEEKEGGEAISQDEGGEAPTPQDEGSTSGDLDIEGEQWDDEDDQEGGWEDEEEDSESEEQRLGHHP